MKRTLSALCFAVLSLAAAAQTPAPAITQLLGFPCDSTLTQCPDGSFPQGFIESVDGNFYGIASAGGTGLNSQGSVFKITPSGQFTLLYSFAELPDGSSHVANAEIDSTSKHLTVKLTNWSYQ